MNEVIIKPILDRDTAIKVIQASQVDGHFIVSPTHYVEKAEKVIGAFSLCKNPTCYFWMDSKEASIRDSLMAINVGENIARVNGQHILLAMAKASSPFHSLLGRLGYSQLDTLTLNAKVL